MWVISGEVLEYDGSWRIGLENMMDARGGVLEYNESRRRGFGI